LPQRAKRLTMFARQFDRRFGGPIHRTQNVEYV